MYLDDLNLNEMEAAVMVRMMGKRYNQNKREIKLTGDRFPNRVENKRHVVLLLEKLLLEARRLAKLAPDNLMNP